MDTTETWDQENIYVLTPTQSNKFSYFFTALLDHDQDDLISEQDFEALIEVTIQVANNQGPRRTFKI